MRNRLFNKFFLTTVIAVILSMLIIVLLMSFAFGNFFSADKKNILKENCQTISQTVESAIGSKYSKPLIENAIKTLAKAIGSEVFITDSKGQMFTCSCVEWSKNQTCIHSNGKISNNIINQAIKNEYYEIGRLSSKYSEPHYTYACPIKSGGEVIGLVFASSPASTLQMLLSEIARILGICSIIPIILLFCLLYIITYRSTKPLKIMSIAAKKISMGDFSTRVPSQGNDEIADLAKSFNHMTDALVKLESTRRSFIANVSHELRTPMTTIGGFIDGIIDGTIEKEKHKHYLDIVSVEIKRLARIVQSMLSLAKLESGEQKANLTSVDLYKIVCQSVISQERSIEEKNIEILGLEKETEAIIDADEDLIYQSIFNLIDNAIKFVNINGYIEFNFEKTDNSVVFRIKNSGEGIKPENLKYVFDRFYKEDKARSDIKNGSGLGLYIVKTIIDIHKGKILVRSLYGEYTEFELQLPIKTQANEMGMVI